MCSPCLIQWGEQFVKSSTSTLLRPPQDYPDVSKQPKWNGKVKADAVDWKATIDEALERGKAVPEVEWCIPGEKAAAQVSNLTLT